MAWPRALALGRPVSLSTRPHIGSGLVHALSRSISWLVPGPLMGEGLEEVVNEERAHFD